MILVLQELDKFSFKTNVIQNGLEKYMTFNINNKSVFIYSFQFLSFSLNSLVTNLDKNDFKYLSQEFNNKVLDSVKLKGFYPYEYMNGFEKFEKELSSKEKFYSSLSSKKSSDNDYEHVLGVWDRFEMKTMKDCHNLYT